MKKSELDVLIVDDEKTIGEQLKGHFEKKGLRATAVQKGEDAIRIVKKEEPKMAIIDLFLPELDGFDLADQIFKVTKDCQIVLMSGIYDFQSENLKNVGIEDFVKKPIQFEKIDKILSKYQMI